MNENMVGPKLYCEYCGCKKVLSPCLCCQFESQSVVKNYCRGCGYVICTISNWVCRKKCKNKAQFLSEILPEVLSEIKQAIEARDEELVGSLAESLIYLADSIEDKNLKADVLNELLVIPGHGFHQEIIKDIQNLGSPSSIPYIRKALESNFDYLEYTCSESAAIAKWFSWALCGIGTTDAIKVIEDFADSENKGISEEMKYRLRYIKEKIACF